MEQILKGWLIKSPPEPKTGGHWKLFGAKWKRRFFVLYAPPLGSGITDYRGAMLEYYTSTKMNTKVGFINLDDCDEILSELDSDTYKHVFGLQTKHKGKDRTYYLVSETEDEMNRWVNHLCRVLGLLENDDCKPIPPPARPPLTPTSNLGMNKRINSEPNLIENNHGCFVSPTGKSSISYAEMAHEQRLKQAGSVPDFDLHSSAFHHTDLPPPRAHPNLPPIPPHKSRQSCDILPDLPTTLSDLPPPKPPKYKRNTKAKSAMISLGEGDHDDENKRVDNDDGDNDKVGGENIEVDNNNNNVNNNDIGSYISKERVKKSTSSSASTIKAYDNDDDDGSDDDTEDVEDDDDGEYKISSPAYGHKDRANDKDVKFNYNNKNNNNNNEITGFYDAPHNNNNNNKTNNNEEQDFYDIPMNNTTTNNNNNTTTNNNNKTLNNNNNTTTTTNNNNNTTINNKNTNNNSNNKSGNEEDDFYDVPAQKHNNNNNNNNYKNNNNIDNNNITDSNNNNHSQDLYDIPLQINTANNINKNDVNNNDNNNINKNTLGGSNLMVTKPKAAKRTSKPKKESENNNHNNNNNEVESDNIKIKNDSKDDMVVENVFNEVNIDREELDVYDVPLKLATKNIENKLDITPTSDGSHDGNIEQPTHQKQPMKPPQQPRLPPQKPLQPQQPHPQQPLQLPLHSHPQQPLEDNVNIIPSQTILKPVRHKRNQLNSNETSNTPPKVAIKPKHSNSIPTVCPSQPPQLPLKPQLLPDIPNEQKPNELSQQSESPAAKKPYQFGSKHTKLINMASLGAEESKTPTVKHSFSQLIKNEIRFTQRSRSFKRSLTSNERPNVKLPIKKFEKEESTSVSSSPSPSDDDCDDDDDDDDGH